MNRDTPKNHRWVETQDGTFTLFSETFQEACHSTSGAKNETLLHYVEGCNITNKLKNSDVHLLEVGFGLGIGLKTTLDSIQGSTHKLKFTSLEIDSDLALWAMENLKKQNLIKNIQQQQNSITAEFKAGTLTVILGDARTSLPDFLKSTAISFNAIYQDAFSPRKNPTLWTREWFELLKEHSQNDVILSTYSASSSIRKSLLAAGWKLHKGEKFGPKRTSTRATLNGVSDPDILLHLERSPAVALTDDNALEYANEKQTLRTSQD